MVWIGIYEEKRSRLGRSPKGIVRGLLPAGLEESPAGTSSRLTHFCNTYALQIGRQSTEGSISSPIEWQPEVDCGRLGEGVLEIFSIGSASQPSTGEEDDPASQGWSEDHCQSPGHIIPGSHLAPVNGRP